jgi:hypothetical protein
MKGSLILSFRHLLLSVLMLLGLDACNLTRTDMNNETVDHAREYKQDEVAAMYRLNPSPKRRYDITMTIENAPGPFGYVKGYAQYKAPDCVYVLDKVAGVNARPEHTLDIDFRQTDQNTYVGSVYLDAILDQDYFGKGLCRWGFTFARAELKATGREEETSFVPSFSSNSLDAGIAVKNYMQRKFYPADMDIKGAAVHGRTDREKMASISDEELMIVSFSIREFKQ